MGLVRRRDAGGIRPELCAARAGLPGMDRRRAPRLRARHGGVAAVGGGADGGGGMSAYYNEFDPHAAQWLRNLISAGVIAPGDVDERSIEDVRPDDLRGYTRSEEHTSELQSRENLVCRLLLEK